MTEGLVFDRSDRTRIHVTGGQAAEMVNGLVTNDIVTLAPGQGAYAAALTAKGKIVADVRIFVEPHRLLLDTSARAAAGLRDIVRKYLNPRFAPHADVSLDLRDLGVFGAGARQIVARATGANEESLSALQPYAHVSVPLTGGGSIMLARVPDLATEGYELFVPATAVGALHQQLLAAGATEGDAETWRARRIEIGWPEWGVEMDDTTLPQEANLDELHALSYTKGCYTGQETVARIHFRGHVNRTLRRLIFNMHQLPPVGAELLDSDGKVIGDVRSTAYAQHAGAVGIGMVRRELSDGAIVRARWPDGECTVRLAGKAKGATE